MRGDKRRTIRTQDGGLVEGRVVVNGLLHRILEQMTKTRPRDQQDDLRDGLVVAMKVARNPKALLEEFDAIGTVWTPPEKTGFEPTRSAA